MAELSASPIRSKTLKRIADTLRELQGPMGQIIPGTDLNPYKLLPAADSVENWAYGNLPMAMPPSGTGGYIPIVKTGRKGEMVDLVGTGLGVAPAVKAAERGAERLSTAAVRAITGNPNATPMGVLEEAGNMVPLNRIFIPAKDEQALAMAKYMEERGMRPEDIWQKTGIGRLPAGRDYVQEISDARSAVTPENLPTIEGSEWQRNTRGLINRYLRDQGYDPLNLNGVPPDVYADAVDEAKKVFGSAPSVPLAKVYKNPDLSAAYPAATFDVRIGPEVREGVGGSFIRDENLVTVKPPSYSANPNDVFSFQRTPEDVRSTITHELQHAVQFDAGHGLGGNPSFAAQQLNKARQYDPAFSPENTDAHWAWKDAVRERGLASKGQYLNQLKDYSQRDGMKPRMIFGMQDWYRFGDEYVRNVGSMPKKPGPARDQWLKGAAQHMLDKNLEARPYDAGLMQEFDKRTARNTIARTDRTIKKNQKGYEEFETARKKYNYLSDVGQKPGGDMSLYKALEGEAMARLAQTRMNLTEAERRANYPFHKQYEQFTYGTSASPKHEKVLKNPYGLDTEPDVLFTYRENYKK